MMDFSDDRWSGLIGGYRLSYDPRPTLKAIDDGNGADAAWSELWEELHHQGDVDTASYAALPWIARLAATGKAGGWNAYALAATIEEARSNSRNPPMPEWLTASYAQGWIEFCAAALNVLCDAEDPLVVSSALAVVAIHKRLPTLGRLAADFSEEERFELLTKAGWA
jgi:hypothetical protein